MSQYKGQGGWHGGGRPKDTQRPEGRKDVQILGHRRSKEDAEIIRAYLKKHGLKPTQYLFIKVEEDMIIPEIARKLLASSETVHEAENIELQNWTNDISDEQLTSLWQYAAKKELKQYSEKENGYTTARFIAKAELEALAV